jgi:hypothetical protein
MQWPHRRLRAPLRFEFQPRRRPAGSAWLLLLVACAFAGDIAWGHADVKRRTEEATRALGALPAASPTAVQTAVYQPRDVEREAAFARGVITKISLPWNDLFKALDATRAEEVQLLGVEPDAEARTLRISAEARDIPAMLTYVARLESNSYFRNVGLLQHEVRSEGPAPGAPGARGRAASSRAGRAAPGAGSSNAVSFTVAASWRQK